MILRITTIIKPANSTMETADNTLRVLGLKEMNRIVIKRVMMKLAIKYTARSFCPRKASTTLIKHVARTINRRYLLYILNSRPQARFYFFPCYSSPL